MKLGILDWKNEEKEKTMTMASNEVTVKTEVARETQVSDQIRCLGDSIDHMKDRIDILVKNLHPVLSQPEPSEAKDDGKISEMVPLANDILNRKYNIDSIIGVINDLISRIRI